MLPEIQQELNFSRPGDKVHDYCDGSISIEQGCLTNNDVYICNPIGSYARKHKLGCMLYTAHVPLFLKAIILVGVGKYEGIAKYGIDHFLGAFIEDLYCEGCSLLFFSFGYASSSLFRRLQR